MSDPYEVHNLNEIPLAVELSVDERTTILLMLDDEMWAMTREMNDHYAAIDAIAVKRTHLGIIKDKLVKEQS